jgi:molybdenum cofactor synthesis domain-containing protein
MPAGNFAMRIVTGAPVPLGADAIVKHEDLIESDGRARLRVPADSIKPSAHIRRRGENVNANAEVLHAGNVISGPAVGALASFGVGEVPVHRLVRVAIISTGDELVSVGASPMDWQLRDGNSPALTAMLGARHWIEVHSVTHVRDDGDQLTAALREAAANADAIVLSGGVSMGHRDFVHSAVRALGARTIFHGLPQRPGKPMLAAVLRREGGRETLPILGLPGNPVSVLVTCRRLAIPILGRLAGVAASAFDGTPRTLAEPDDARIDLWWHRAVSQDADRGLRLIANRSSGDFAAVAGSAGFVEIPPGESGTGPWPFFAWDH